MTAARILGVTITAGPLLAALTIAAHAALQHLRRPR